MTQDRNAPISAYILERYALGELPVAELRMVEARLAEDASLRQRLEALTGHNRIFADRFPAEMIIPEIEASLRMPPKTAVPDPRRSPDPMRAQSTARIADFFRIPRGWQVAGAFALLMLAALPILMVLPPETIPEGERLKGMKAELRLYRDTPTGPQRLVNGALASPGDVIQIEFHPGESAYGAIVSVDGSGAVTWHWPRRPDAGTALSALPEHRLPEAFRLDDAPGFERFYLLLSHKPLETRDLASLITASSKQDDAWLAGKLPEPVRAVGFTLVKGP